MKPGFHQPQCCLLLLEEHRHLRYIEINQVINIIKFTVLKFEYESVNQLVITNKT